MIRYIVFSIGLAILVVGALTVHAPDWDIPISIIMATLTLLTSEYWLKTFTTLNWVEMPLALFLAWFSADGSYWLYWSVVDPTALVFRDDAIVVNVCMYIACALFFSLARRADIYLSIKRIT